MTQDFIQTFESKAIINNIIIQLKNEQMQNIEINKDLSVVIKKILLQMII